MFATIVDHVVPLSVDLSILYPVMAEPPLFVGATQDRLICDVEILVAVRPVGDPGAVDEVEPVSTIPASVLKYEGIVSYGFGRTSSVM